MGKAARIGTTSTTGAGRTSLAAGGLLPSVGPDLQSNHEWGLTEAIEETRLPIADPALID
jgi:hypothetical protein